MANIYTVTAVRWALVREVAVIDVTADDPDEARELGLDEYRDHAALIAEWPGHAGGFAHEPGCLAITLEGLPQGRRGEVLPEGRRAIVTPGVDWLGRATWIPV